MAHQCESGGSIPREEIKKHNPRRNIATPDRRSGNDKTFGESRVASANEGTKDDVREKIQHHNCTLCLQRVYQCP